MDLRSDSFCALQPEGRLTGTLHAAHRVRFLRIMDMLQLGLRESHLEVLMEARLRSATVHVCSLHQPRRTVMLVEESSATWTSATPFAVELLTQGRKEQQEFTESSLIKGHCVISPFLWIQR